ncbi:MAG: cobalamin-dependent protein, partial [Bdellovibrionales bacterium]|nr:cobalamin-dependent protein [Bdellovibrionales bacterium]
IITAASLFDGHDASINIMRRMLQDFGAEVIHLGHNRSVMDIVTAALQEGAQAICVSSYQGGHMEFFKYMKDLLVAFGANYVKIYGGGGGVIVHDEKRELENYGIDQIFHPDDGRRLGLDGMIRMIVESADFDLIGAANKSRRAGGPRLSEQHKVALKTLDSETAAQRKLDRLRGLQLCALESKEKLEIEIPGSSKSSGDAKAPLVLGMTGTGGAGKSSLIDELAHRFLNGFENMNVGIFCVDPTKRKTGGALLGDRIRMNSLSRPRTYMRSIASRGSGREVSDSLPEILDWAAHQNFDLVIAETSGIGQGNTAITEVADLSLYVMTSEFGAQSQLEKIDMIDYADVIAINKADRRGSQDALRDVRKQYRRSRQMFHEPADQLLPVFLTQASQFNDAGVNSLFFKICEELTKKDDPRFRLSEEKKKLFLNSTQSQLIPAHRQNYLAEIARAVRDYKQQTETQAEALSQLQAIDKTLALVSETKGSGVESKVQLAELKTQVERKVDEEVLGTPSAYRALTSAYHKEALTYEVRGRKIHQPIIRKSLSGIGIPRVSVPKLSDWGDQYRYLRLENVPGRFPYTAGVFELKRDEEEPRRQFAGEGSPARTNKRFHFLSHNDSAKRLSTAFDSVTLYGEDPALRPDIYGKVGESGVSICTLQDMKRLYDGFDLLSPSTSVSMTINGPAVIVFCMFLANAQKRGFDL